MDVALDHVRRLLRAVRERPAPYVLALLAGLVAVAFVWRLLDASVASPPDAQLPLATRGTAAAAPSVSAARVVVHVAGAVERPGVYQLAEGSRVIDAIGAAGGPRADADLARVNLAARLTDALRVYVPAIGELALPATDGGHEVASGPLDLNTATEEQLDELPGIGPATASAIVAYRRDHGPFRSVDELLEVRGIGPAKLEELRALVAV